MPQKLLKDQKTKILRFLLREGPSYTVAIARHFKNQRQGIPHASLWKDLEELAKSGYVEEVSGARGLRKGSRAKRVRKAYRLTASGFVMVQTGALESRYRERADNPNPWLTLLPYTGKLSFTRQGMKQLRGQPLLLDGVLLSLNDGIEKGEWMVRNLEQIRGELQGP